MSGSLALTCARRDGRSRIVHVRYDGLVRASRTQRDGDAARIVLAHLGPGILGGDTYAFAVAVERDAALTLAGQMATPVYARARPSQTRATYAVGAGASLVVRAEPLMLDANARHDAVAGIDVEPGGRAILTELVTVAPGALVRLRTTARIGGRLVARDACDVGAHAGAVATLIVVTSDDARRARDARVLEALLASAHDVRGGVGATAGALVVRATCARVWPLARLVDDLLGAMRPPEPALASSRG